MIASALFDVLETQALLASNGLEVSVLAPGVPMLYSLSTAELPPVRGR